MSVSASSSSLNDISSISYEELYAKKARYIDTLKFEKAQQIEDMIQEKRKNDNVDHFQSAKNRMEDNISKNYKIYLDNCNNIKLNAEDAEMKLREHADSSFSEMKDRHLEELTRIEKEFYLESIRAKQKPVKAQLDNYLIAKQLAKDNDFAGAVQMRTLADNLYAKEQNERQEELVRKYAVIRKQCFDKQKNELLILNQKLGKNLRRLERTIEDDILVQTKQFAVSVRSEQQRVLLDITRSVQKIEEKKSVADELNQFVVSKALEISGISIDQVAPIKSPTKSSRQSTPQTTPRTPRSQQESEQQTQKEENGENEDENEDDLNDYADNNNLNEIKQENQNENESENVTDNHNNESEINDNNENQLADKEDIENENLDFESENKTDNDNDSLFRLIENQEGGDESNRDELNDEEKELLDYLQ